MMVDKLVLSLNIMGGSGGGEGGLWGLMPECFLKSPVVSNTMFILHKPKKIYLALK